MRGIAPDPGNASVRVRRRGSTLLSPLPHVSLAFAPWQFSLLHHRLFKLCFISCVCRINIKTACLLVCSFSHLLSAAATYLPCFYSRVPVKSLSLAALFFLSCSPLSLNICPCLNHPLSWSKSPCLNPLSSSSRRTRSSPHSTRIPLQPRSSSTAPPDYE